MRCAIVRLPARIDNGIAWTRHLGDSPGSVLAAMWPAACAVRSEGELRCAQLVLLGDDDAGFCCGRGRVSEPGVSAGAPVSRVLRFGQRITRDDLPFALQAGGSGAEGAIGTLISAQLTKDASDIWLRLGVGGLLRPTKYQTIHVYGNGPDEASPDGFLLHDDLRARCHEGYVGKVEGLALDLRTGEALGVLLHVRSDVLSAITRAWIPTTNCCRWLASEFWSHRRGCAR